MFSYSTSWRFNIYIIKNLYLLLQGSIPSVLILGRICTLQEIYSIYGSPPPSIKPLAPPPMPPKISPPHMVTDAVNAQTAYKSGGGVRQFQTDPRRRIAPLRSHNGPPSPTQSTQSPPHGLLQNPPRYPVARFDGPPRLRLDHNTGPLLQNPPYQLRHAPPMVSHLRPNYLNSQCPINSLYLCAMISKRINLYSIFKFIFTFSHFNLILPEYFL